LTLLGILIASHGLGGYIHNSLDNRKHDVEVCKSAMSGAGWPKMCSTMAAPYLVKIEDQIQLTDIAKVSVEHLHKVVHKLQCDQLIVTAVNAHDKV